MGMFDTVVWDCPECGAEGSIREQTKGMPEPQLREFPSHSVPINATRDISQYVVCDACQRQYMTLALVPLGADDDADLIIPMPLLRLVRTGNGIAVQVSTHLPHGSSPPGWKGPTPFYTEPVDHTIV